MDCPVVTVFRNKLRPDADGYNDELARMLDVVHRMPGFIESKTFTADDGERVTIIMFRSLEQQRAWFDHPGHRAAQQRGRDEFYEFYRLQVCQLVRESTFEQGGERLQTFPQG
jgi:heme-degrading monooxygenase HmoA